MDCDIVLCLLCRFLSRLDTLWWIMLVVVGFGWNWRAMVCWPDVLLGGAVGELVCEVTAVGMYAGRPLKAGDAAQPRGCSARFVPAVFGPVWICCWFGSDLCLLSGETAKSISEVKPSNKRGAHQNGTSRLTS